MRRETPSSPPRVEPHSVFHGARVVGRDGETAEVVAVPVGERCGTGARRGVHSHDAKRPGEVGAGFAAAVCFEVFFVEETCAAVQDETG